MKNCKILTNILLATILLTFGIGCNSLQMPKSGESVGGGMSETTEPKTAIETSLKNFMDAKSYHSVIKTKNALSDVETEVSFSAPDKFWIKNNIPTMQSEIIVVGNDAFSRIGGGKWTKMPSTNGLSITDLRGKYSNESFAAMKNFEFVGKESLDGKDALVFKYASSYGGESVSKMWIEPASSLPIRVETEGTYSGTKVQMSIVYDFERQVNIETPKVN